MHDFSHFRKNFDAIAERLSARSNPPNLEQFRELDRERRAAISQVEQLKAEANKLSGEVGQLRQKKDPSLDAEIQSKQDRVRSLKGQIAGQEGDVEAADQRFQELLKGVPNVPHESVPVGHD